MFQRELINMLTAPIQICYSATYILNNEIEGSIAATAMLNLEIIDLSQGTSKFEQYLSEHEEVKNHIVQQISDKLTKSTNTKMYSSELNCVVTSVSINTVGIPPFPTMNEEPF